MNNQMQNAPRLAHGEEKTSDVLAAQLAEARAKRGAMNEEAGKALEGMEANFHTAMEIQFKRGELGHVQGMLGFESNFAEGHIAAALLESGEIKPTLIPIIVGALQAMRFAPRRRRERCATL